MEELAHILILQKLVRDLNIASTSNSSGVRSAREYLNHIYRASKVRIFEVVDRVHRPYIYTGDLLREIQNNQITVQEEWEFRLGNRVKVKYPLEELKHIQRDTIGWGSQLKRVVGLRGFVSDVYSKYDNVVQVYFPELRESVPLYAGVLQTIPNAERDEEIASKWTVGDYVKTRNDENLVKLLQQGHGEIPDLLIGRKARVISITKASVFVTYDEKTSSAINSALLLPSDDHSVIRINSPEDSHGFIVGDKVNVIPNMRKMVQNQKATGILGFVPWAPAMSELCGKQVTVTDINGNGTVDVKLGAGQSWIISSKSLSKLVDMSNDEDGNAKFKPGDSIQIKIPENAGNVLAQLGIPSSFLEYVKSTAVVYGMDGDFDLMVRFNCNQNIAVNESLTMKPDETTAQKHKTVTEKVENLKHGDRVFLDVGPPNFVTDILRKDNAEKWVIDALTKPSTLLGFTDKNHVVIEYDNGRKIRINKKYLTVPEKFDVKDLKLSQEVSKKSVFDMAPIMDFQTSIANLNLGMEFAVNILEINFQDGAKNIRFKIESAKEPSNDMIQSIQDHTGWDLQYLGNGMFNGKMS